MKKPKVAPMQKPEAAPIMKKNKFLVKGDDSFLSIQKFLRRMLRIKAGDPLFLFCNNAFAPSPDETIQSLFACFQVNSELIINYQIAGAWG